MTSSASDWDKYTPKERKQRKPRKPDWMVKEDGKRKKRKPKRGGVRE